MDRDAGLRMLCCSEEPEDVSVTSELKNNRSVFSQCSLFSLTVLTVFSDCILSVLTAD